MLSYQIIRKVWYITFLVICLAGCAGGSSVQDASRTVTILYTHNTNGLLESCG